LDQEKASWIQLESLDRAKPAQPSGFCPSVRSFQAGFIGQDQHALIGAGAARRQRPNKMILPHDA